LPCLLALSSLAISNASTKWCDYVNRVVEGNVPFDYYQEVMLVTRMIGLWSYEGVGAYAGTCYAYPEGFEYDDYFTFARIMSILTSIIGGICAILLFTSVFVGFNRATFVSIAMGLFVTMVLESLTLLVFKSDFCNTPYELEKIGISVRCEHAWGSQSDIFASLLWFCTFLSVCLIRPPPADVIFTDTGSNVIIIHQTEIRSNDQDLTTPLVDNGQSSATEKVLV